MKTRKLDAAIPHGFFVDEHGNVCSTETPGGGYHCVMAHADTHTVVMRCNSQNFVDGEFVWYPSREAIAEVLA